MSEIMENKYNKKRDYLLTSISLLLISYLLCFILLAPSWEFNSVSFLYAKLLNFLKNYKYQPQELSSISYLN